MCVMRTSGSLEQSVRLEVNGEGCRRVGYGYSKKFTTKDVQDVHVEVHQLRKLLSSC